MIRAIKKTTAFLLCTATIFSMTACSYTSDNLNTEKQNDEKKTYANTLFDTSYVHTIEITTSDEDWTDLLDNPLDKTKYHADITIDGEKIDDVSFATKGNTSLSQVASDSDTDRYSFKVNFGKYQDGQTYYGLDKLNLNNLYADATYMKDYLSYEIFRAIDADAPLTSYVYITVNGEKQGLYLAVEEVGESFLERLNDGEGQLYKPETEQLNNVGNLQDKNMNHDMNIPDDERPELPQMPQNETGENSDNNTPVPPDMNQTSENDGFANGNHKPDGMGFGSSSNGASLSYTDDSISSYSDIFDNAETDATEEDMQRVIEALKQLSANESLEECLDTDSIIRYFVAHNFVMNYDSYTGNMLHNYYLYENNGKLSLIPWDYNLGFGAFSGGGGNGFKGNTESTDKSKANGNKENSNSNNSNATSIINWGIDSPLSGATEEDRPMWAWIVNNDEYLELYHKYYDELITNYFESGKCASEIERVFNMILPYVEDDPTAFYSVDEFKTAYSTISEFVKLRAESIRKQLDGSLAAVSSDQNESDRVDASNIVISTMGSQMGKKK